MNNDNDHNDAFEDFYKSKFGDAEMDIPSGLVDSLMDSLPTEPIPEPKKQRFSERIGTAKLWRALKVSLLLNLVTVSFVGYYVFFSPEKTIIIESPIESVSIAKPKNNEINIDTVTEVTLTTPTIRSNPKTTNTARVTSAPIIEDTTNESMATEELATIVPNTSSNQDSTKKVTIDAKEEIIPAVKTGPKDLDAYRKTLQDSLNGRKLFE